MAKNIFFKTLMLKGEAGGTITSIEKIGVSGGAYVFRIHLSDGSSEDFEVNETVDTDIVESLITAATPGIVSQAGAQTDAKIESAILNKIYPVGSIFMSTVSTNPGTYLGGTWEAWGSGRIPVGIDTNDSDFDTPNKTGGSKSHTLTVDEIPAHSHTHSHNINYDEVGGLSDKRMFSGHVDSESGEDKYTFTAANAQGVPGTLDIQKVESFGNPLKTDSNSTSAGGGQAHSILNPYIVCYMWRRVS